MAETFDEWFWFVFLLFFFFLIQQRIVMPTIWICCSQIWNDWYLALLGPVYSFDKCPVVWETAHGHWQNMALTWPGRIWLPSAFTAKGWCWWRYRGAALGTGMWWMLDLQIPSISSSICPPCHVLASALGNGELTECRLGLASWQIQIWLDLKN